MAHLGTKLPSQKSREQLEVLPGAEQCSEQEGAELAWGGKGVDQVVRDRNSVPRGWVAEPWLG